MNVRAHLLSSLNAADFLVTLPSTSWPRFLQNDGNTEDPGLAPAARGGGQEDQPQDRHRGAGAGDHLHRRQTGGGGGTFAPATSFQYRNVGVNLELTPRVTPNGDIMLEMAAEFSLPGTPPRPRPAQILPTFLTRNVNGTLRLRDGETALLGGLLQDSEIETFTRHPRPAEHSHPEQASSTGTEKTKTQTEILFSITPHLVRAPKISEEDLRSIFIGTQEILRVPGGGDPLFGAPEPVALAGTARRPRRPPAPRPGGRRARSRRRCPKWTRSRTPAATPPPARPRCRRRCPPASRTRAHAGRRGRSCRSRAAAGRPAGGRAAGSALSTLLEPPAPAASPAPRPGAAGTAPAGPREPSRRRSALRTPGSGSAGRPRSGSWCMGVQDLTGVELALAYDPALLEAVDVSPGSLLTLDGVPVGAERGLESGRVRARFQRATGPAGSGRGGLGDLPGVEGGIVDAARGEP